jgi:hypothetical protein
VFFLKCYKYFDSSQLQFISAWYIHIPNVLCCHLNAVRILEIIQLVQKLHVELMTVTDFHPIMKLEVEHCTMKFKHLNLVPQIEFTCRLIDSGECDDILSCSVPNDPILLDVCLNGYRLIR